MCVCVCVCVCARTRIVHSSIMIKKGFHVARAETPPRECDLSSELRIAKMHHRQKFEYYCT